MCGIAGIYHFDNKKIDQRNFSQFTATLNHRGPDSEGEVLLNDDRLALAHKRLSILDISQAGHQPMISASGKYIISYNGEVYNFLELRKDLNQKGYQFKTQTDTEVILAAYEHWGTECFNKFNGMWSMAIYHFEDGKLLLCRDRFGIKPLYYKHYGNFFAFASETNAFEKIKGKPRSIDRAIFERSIIDPYYSASFGASIFDGIVQIKPGHYMLIEENGITVQKQYYHFYKNCASNADLTYKFGDFYNLFEDAVKLRLRSDVPIATAFSGGIDSTAVFAMVNYLAKKSFSDNVPKEWQKGFCLSFANSANDDTPFAKAAIEEMNWNADFINLTPHTIIDKIIHDTKFYDDLSTTPLTSISPIYNAIKNNGFSVSLDGHGADEYLFGYRNMVNDLYYNSLLYNGKKTSKQIAVALKNMYPPADQKALKKRLISEINEAYKGGNYFKRLWRNTIHTNECDTEIIKQNFFISPLPALLKNFDKASMQHGVEVRMPFMDYRLVEMCYNIPWTEKIKNGQSKWIIRNELKTIMPKVVLNRNHKIGISGPLEQWLNLENRKKLLPIIREGKNMDYMPAQWKNQDLLKIDNATFWLYLNIQLIQI